MSPDVSIVYSTCRVDPHFEWFADGLARQLHHDAVEVILVDGLHTPERTARFAAMVADRFAFRHVPAKPTPLAGRHRLTTRDCFAAASARNTGLVYASAPYVAFVDDLSVVMPGWWSEVRAGAMRGDVLAGAYQKHREMAVQAGQLLRSRVDETGIDSRWSLGRDNALVPIAGSQLFGCSLALPRERLLEVNGFDELCDGTGGEDWHLGMRLEWAGARILYNRRMLTVESDELHHVGTPAARSDWTVPPSVYHRRLREFGVAARYVPGRCDTSHMILDLLFGARTSQTLGNYYWLPSVDEAALAALPRRFPKAHWFDGRAWSSV